MRKTLLVVVMFAASCSASRPAITEEAVRQLNRDWIAAEASNNVDAALGFLWEDATMQPPNAPEIHGHPAIRAAYEKVRFVSLTMGQTRVQVSGDLATIWGPLTVVIQGPAGPITLDEKFVAVWLQRGGKWKVIENSWSDNALAAAGSAAATGELSATDVAAIRATSDRWVAGVRARRWNDVAATFTADAILRFPDATYEGRAAILKYFESSPPWNPTRTLHIDEIRGRGDMAFVSGHSTIVPETGGAPVVVGRYLGIGLRQADGTWLFYRDMVSPVPIK